jgi:Asp/Glu/Hydantoin racemase
LYLSLGTQADASGSSTALSKRLLKPTGTPLVKELEDYLVEGIETLAHAGATFGFLAADTPHIVFEEVQQRSAIPLLSIVRAACEHARSLGLKTQWHIPATPPLQLLNPVGGCRVRWMEAYPVPPVRR